jgi:hypothetical protein
MARNPKTDDKPMTPEPAAAPKEEQIKGVPKWRAESAFRSLQDAEDVKADPKLHKAAKHVAKTKLGGMQAIASTPTMDMNDDGDMEDAPAVSSVQDLKNSYSQKYNANE